MGSAGPGRVASTSSTEKAANMDPLHPSIIDSWHAHVYFEACSRETAWALRETINVELTGRMEMGRFHEKPVGPHPMWSYQLAFPAENFSQVVGWLTLNHGALDVFVHPNTGDELRDHRDCALWLGKSHTLNLAALSG
jgi:DOPA 4,5-dioxygenase